jgi:hypothetical protein
MSFQFDIDDRGDNVREQAIESLGKVAYRLDTFRSDLSADEEKQQVRNERRRGRKVITG